MEKTRYRKFNTFLRDIFGEKVYKISLYGSFTCPNRDGSKGTGGCIFCNPASSRPLNYIEGMSVKKQLETGADYIRKRHKTEKFIAYFMDYSTTYGDIEKLSTLYREAINFPGVVGLSLCTRPDCLSGEVLDLLEEISGSTYLWVELGIQTSNPETLMMINRCHTVEESEQAILELKKRNIAVSGHVVLGLPGEEIKDMIDTACFLAKTGVNGAKIQNLHVIEDTVLADMYRQGKIHVMELEEYVNQTIRFLEHLPPSMIIQRITGEAPRHLTVAPDWSVNKLAVINAIIRELEKRNTWQGKAIGSKLEDLKDVN